MLTLAEAVKTGSLDDFISQEEARGVGPIDPVEFDGLAAPLIKAPQSEDQTSRSVPIGGLSGKRTRKGSGPCASH
jgi:hypothetical protein